MSTGKCAGHRRDRGVKRRVEEIVIDAYSCDMPENTFTQSQRLSQRAFRRLVVFALFVTLGATSALGAHDFFLVPGAIPYAAGADAEILAQSSSRFPTSAGAIALARIARAVVIGSDGETTITDMSVRGTSLVLRSRPTGRGQRLVAVDLVPRSARQTPAEMLRWLKLEGAESAAGRIEQGTALDGLDSVTRTDMKHAKTIIQIGTGGARAYSRSSGQMIELTPLRDPSTLRAGGTLGARLTYKGAPLPGISMHVSVPAPVDTAKKAEADLHLVTDSDGVVTVPIRKTGLWLIRTIHVLEISRGNWETHWASLVVRAGR